ncbi:MAG: LysE/ArgO family amino acid transporter [Pauljensenia sp.]|nr:LysE family transporter [Propionibacterium sp.]
MWEIAALSTLFTPIVRGAVFAPGLPGALSAPLERGLPAPLDGGLPAAFSGVPSAVLPGVFPSVIPVALSGMAMGFGLIVAIGPQNALVLRQGVRGEHAGVAVAVCILSDFALITAGSAGLGALVASHSVLLALATVVGAGVLAVYGFQALRRAIVPGALDIDASGGRATARSVARRTLALTWLNPHVYLDTVVLLGSVSAAQSVPWAFAAGACIASLMWFCLLGFGSRALRPLLATGAAWRVFEAAVALVMGVMAVRLLAGLGA